MSRSHNAGMNIQQADNNDTGGRALIRILDDNQWHLIRKQFRMSPRELEVAKFVCSGFSNEEIAARLRIKCATVKTHLRNIYRRINVQRKLDMLLKFLDNGFKTAERQTSIFLPVVNRTDSRK